MATKQMEAIDLNPLHWLGNSAASAVGDAWKSAMTGLWSAGLWILRMAFKVIDSFTTPDLSAHGPMSSVLPTTLWVGATLAGIMMFVQLTVALIRRDGESMGRILLGIGQFGLVWVGYLGMAAGMVAAAAGLSRGILSSMLHVQSLSDFNLAQSWPTSVGDITLATVLGVLSLLLVIPAAFFYILIMLVREAALIILVATAPISAGGLVSDVGKVWFWKTLRWFFACLLISPCAALVLGVGVKVSEGAINSPKPPACYPHCSASWVLNHSKEMTQFTTSSNAAEAGMAIVGCIVMAIGAVCPLVLFRLLAFVEPGTASGAALRQSWSNAGGMSGVVRGGQGASGGSSASTAASADGRAAGESGAESQTQTRLTNALGLIGSGMQAATGFAQKAADIGSDVLGGVGVGSPGYSMTPTDERGGGSGGSRPSGAGGTQQGGGQDGGQQGPTEPPMPPTPSGPPSPPTPGPGSGPGQGPTGPSSPPGPGAPGGGAGAAGGGAAEAAAVVAL